MRVKGQKGLYTLNCERLTLWLWIFACWLFMIRGIFHNITPNAENAIFIMQIEVKVQTTILPYLLNCNSYEVDFFCKWNYHMFVIHLICNMKIFKLTFHYVNILFLISNHFFCLQDNFRTTQLNNLKFGTDKYSHMKTTQQGFQPWPWPMTSSRRHFVKKMNF